MGSAEIEGKVVKAQLVKYSRRYSDDSGEEFAVTGDLEKGVVTLKSQSCEVDIPVDELRWFLDALHQVENEMDRK
jgi:hypothetical protein